MPQGDGHQVGAALTTAPHGPGLQGAIPPTLSPGKMCHSSPAIPCRDGNNTSQWCSATRIANYDQEAMGTEMKSQVPPHCEEELLSRRVWSLPCLGDIPSPPG